MKCVVIASSDSNKVEGEINAWFQANPNAKIFTITQVPHGNRFVLTTIYYQ